MDQFGIRPLCPTPRGWIEFVREDAHGNRDGDAFDIEKANFPKILPIETSRRKRRVRQPVERDVVEDVVAREALGLSRQRRVRSARSCARRDQGTKPPGRRVNPRFRIMSAGGSPSRSRRRVPFDIRTASARTRPSHRLRGRMAAAPRKKSPCQCRLERCQACWCECPAIPVAPGAISSVMIAPQSPPCATNRVYPRRFISTTQARAMWAGPSQ